MKLNGWKRIGIIASIIWVLGVGLYTFISSNNAAEHISGEMMSGCEKQDNELRKEGIERRDQVTTDDECISLADKYYARMFSVDEVSAVESVGAALICVPFGWGFAYLVLFIVHWIRRGFVRSG